MSVGSALGCRRDAGGPLVYNVGLAQRGGPAAEPAQTVEMVLRGADDLIPADLPESKDEAAWLDSEPPAHDQTGHLSLAGVHFGLELCRDDRERGRRSRLAPALPGDSDVQICIQPACGFKPEPGGVAGLSFSCNGFLAGECGLRQAGSAQAVEVSRTVSVDADDLDFPALFSGRSAGKLSLYPPQDLPEARSVDHFVDFFDYTTKNGYYHLSFSFTYGRNGKLDQTRVQVRLGERGKVMASQNLPCAVEMDDPEHPFIARLAVRYAPVSTDGRDLLLFVDLEGGIKGALHNFSSRVPVVKSVAKPEAKTTAKPAVKASPKPVAKAVAKPTSKATAKPAAKASPKPVAKAVAKPTSKATAKPAAKASPKPMAKAVAKPTSKATAKPAAKASPKPVAKARTNSKPYKLQEIEGIGLVIGKVFETQGITTVNQLLSRGRDPKSRKLLVDETGLSAKLILRWCNMADLFRIKGVAEEYSDLLEAAGVDTVPELAQRNAANLHKQMLAVNKSRRLVRLPPSQKQAADWVAQARELPRLMTY